MVAWTIVVRGMLFTTLLWTFPSLVHADDSVFQVMGTGQSWAVQDFFSKAQLNGRDKLGYEFGPILTYRGPSTNIKWYRIEVFLAEDPRLDSKPDCTITSELAGPEGPLVSSGQVFTHGRCRLVPWTGTITQTKQVVLNGAYVITWRSVSGVHAESVRVSPSGPR